MTARVLDGFSQLIASALGLVAALAWNPAIQRAKGAEEERGALFGRSGDRGRV